MEILKRRVIYLFICLLFSGSCNSESTDSLFQIADLCVITKALKLYKNDVGEFPEVDVGLFSLVVNVNDKHGWNGPYINYSTKNKNSGVRVLDRYGFPIIYRISEAQELILYSIGENGIDDGAAGDDLKCSDF